VADVILDGHGSHKLPTLAFKEAKGNIALEIFIAQHTTLTVNIQDGVRMYKASIGVPKTDLIFSKLWNNSHKRATSAASTNITSVG
jgi:hypothetical protein